MNNTKAWLKRIPLSFLFLVIHTLAGLLMWLLMVMPLPHNRVAKGVLDILFSLYEAMDESYGGDKQAVPLYVIQTEG